MYLGDEDLEFGIGKLISELVGDVVTTDSLAELERMPL